jgi:hypothetical protein
MRINPYIKKDKTYDGTVINFIDITESKNCLVLLKQSSTVVLMELQRKELSG